MKKLLTCVVTLFILTTPLSAQRPQLNALIVAVDANNELTPGFSFTPTFYNNWAYFSMNGNILFAREGVFKFFPSIDSGLRLTFDKSAIETGVGFVLLEHDGLDQANLTANITYVRSRDQNTDYVIKVSPIINSRRGVMVSAGIRF